MATAKTAARTLELTFERERETKNAVRFAEVVDDGDEAQVGTLYVRKFALKNLDATAAEQLTVTIEVA